MIGYRWADMNWYTKIAQTQGIRLWLDDERDPKNPQIQKLFRSQGDELWVKTAPEAIKMLQQGNVTFIDFDNDLGPPEAGEGRHVADWIETQAFHGRLKPLTWRVHSMNIIGSEKIYTAMTSADRFWQAHADNEDSDELV